MLMQELQTENDSLRRLLTIGQDQSEQVSVTLERIERQQYEMCYKEDMRKRQEWEGEVERIRVEVASQLQAKYNERVHQLEQFYEDK